MPIITPPVDAGLAAWLKSEALLIAPVDTDIQAVWTTKGVDTAITSAIAGRTDAIAEATRQLRFLGGPLVRDEHVVSGARHDLIGRRIKLRTYAVQSLGYTDDGVMCFVIGAVESDSGETTTLTVLRRLDGGMPPPAKLAVAYISPGGAGNNSGEDWANAAPIASLNAMIAKASQIGGEVWIRADAGSYNLPIQLPVNQGGAPASRVVVRGVDVAGNDMKATLVGNRAPNWTKGQAVGGEHFWLNAGASYLLFRNLVFQDAGTSIRLRQSNVDLTFEDIDFWNVRRGIQNSASSGSVATISGLTIRRCNGHGFSKQLFQVRHDTNGILIEDCYGDAEMQDGDFWSQGVVFDDTAHDAIVRRCTMRNCWYNAGDGYWNGDGFVGERGNYGLLFEDCISLDNTDAGFDFKSTARFVRCRSERNKRNFRVWGHGELIDCIGIDPTNRGGSGSSGQVYGYDDSRAIVRGGTWSTATGSTPFHAFEAGFIAVDQDAIDATTGNYSQLFVDEGGGIDAQHVVLDYSDTTPPVIQQITDEAPIIDPMTGNVSYAVYTPSGNAIALAKDENKPMSFFVQVSEKCTLRATGQNADRINPEGRRLLIKGQDFDALGGAAGDGTNVLKFNLIATDANNNDSIPLACSLTINDVADAPITPAEAFSYSGADGMWTDLANASILYADTSMTIPAQVGQPVLAVYDQSGSGKHLIQPDPEQAAVLRVDKGLQYLEFNGNSTNYLMGAPGDFRYPQFTAFAAFQRDTDAGDARGILMFFGRRGTSVASSSNGTFWIAVQDASFASWRRTSGSTSGIDGGAPKKKGVVLSLRNSDGVFRFNGGTLSSDSADSAGNAYPLSAEQAYVGCRVDETGRVSFLKGRLYALAVLNQAAPDDIRFRIERQLGQSAGASL